MYSMGSLDWACNDKWALTVGFAAKNNNPYPFVQKVSVIDASEDDGEIEYQVEAMIGGCFHGGGR